MPRDTAPNSSWDDDEPTDVGDDSALDALDEYVPAEEPDDAADPWDTPEPSKRDDGTRARDPKAGGGGDPGERE